MTTPDFTAPTSAGPRTPRGVAAWVSAFRLRTLPLALASIGMGAALAAADAVVRWPVVALCALTTVLLQILSNLANDYGDTQNGADSGGLRQGPARAVQSGAIAPEAMFRAIIICGLLALLSGLALLWVAFGAANLPAALAFLALGLACIWAAYRYTAGANPYGYAGWGDASVFVFFGLVGVLGTYFLQAQTCRWALVLPAAALGLLSSGVLTINNIRDLESDAATGKITIPVRLGAAGGRYYLEAQLYGAIGLLVVFRLQATVGFAYQQWLFLLVTVPLLGIMRGVHIAQTATEIDPFLKRLALTTVALVAFWWAGIN